MKNLRKILVLICLVIAGHRVSAQKVDSIYFHLYTDSLKKGFYNYINVDGKLSNGSWLPLTAKEIQFSSSACTFSGNDLIVPADFSGDKIIVKAVLKSRPSTWLERTIWIKRLPDPELPTREEVMKPSRNSKRKGNNT